MQLVIKIDVRGLIAVEIVANSEKEQAEAHKLYKFVEAELSALDVAAKRFSEAKENVEKNKK
jgi:hypothetical protein